MRFNELVKSTREEKLRLYGRAYTQKACGSRMTPPVTQNGWSSYETQDRQREYNTVKQIAVALNIPEEEWQGFFKAAGYDPAKDLHVSEATEGTPTDRRPAEMTREKIEQLELLKSQVQNLTASLDALLKS